jgi:hypothetical protein
MTARPIFLFTIAAEHVHKSTVQVGRNIHHLGSAIGRVQPGDVGKRVYRVGDILQVENDDQRAARLAGPLRPAEQRARAERERNAAPARRLSRKDRETAAADDRIAALYERATKRAQPRCEYVVNPGYWPYVARCTEDALPDSEWCAEHAAGAAAFEAEAQR